MPKGFDEEYWRERHQKLEEKNFKDVLSFEKEMQKEYNKQMKDLEKTINDFLVKYAVDNKITHKESEKLLTKIEFEEYIELMKKYKKEFAKTGSEELKNKMELLTARQRITRFQSLKDQIEMKMESISLDQTEKVEELFIEQYKCTFEETVNLFNSQLKLEKVFASPSIRALKNIVQYPYSGDMFSNRIWKANNKMVTNLTETLKLGMVQGKSIDAMSADFKKKMMDSTGNNYSTFDVRRVIRTESRFIQERAKADANEEFGCEEYEIIAEHDERQCNHCESMDGRVYRNEDRVEGTNCPPFHPQCRCTTAPYISDEFLEEVENEFIESAKKK